jgi:hypothetical protein
MKQRMARLITLETELESLITDSLRAGDTRAAGIAAEMLARCRKMMSEEGADAKGS